MLDAKLYFPEGCWLGFNEDGTVTDVGQGLLERETLNDWQGKGAVQPCYGCNVEPCDVRRINKGDIDKKYYMRPSR